MGSFRDPSTLSDKALEEEQAWALHRAHEIRDRLPLSVERGGYHSTSKRDAKRKELEELERYISELTAELARRGIVCPR